MCTMCTPDNNNMELMNLPVTDNPRNLFFGIRSRENLPILRFGEQDRLFIMLVGLFQLLRDTGMLNIPYEEKAKHRKKGANWCCGLLLCLLVFLFFGYLLHTTEAGEKIKMVMIRNLFGWLECKHHNNVNVTLYIRPHKKTTLIDPSDVCPNATKHQLLLLVFVNSAIRNFEARKNIRQTWGSFSNYNTTVNLLAELRKSYALRDYPYVDRYGIVNIEALQEKNEKFERQKILVYCEPVFRVVFVLGRPSDNDHKAQNNIDKEAALYNDVIQEDFVDTYENLTLKTLMAMKWAINQCGDSVRYIMKSDDDVFINMPLMIEKLKDRADNFDTNNMDPEEYALFGVLKNFHAIHLPTRDRTNKYYVPRCYYPDDTPFPSFLSGSSGYVMSMPVARALQNASRVTSYLNMEDVYITGLTVQQSDARVRLENDNSFHEAVGNLYNAVRTCLFLDKVAIGGVDFQKLWAMHRRIVDIRELQKCYLKVYG